MPSLIFLSETVKQDFGKKDTIPKGLGLRPSHRGCVKKGNCQPGQNMKKCKGLRCRLPWQYVQSWVISQQV